MNTMTEQEAREMEENLTIHPVAAIRITNLDTGKTEVVGTYRAEDVIGLLDKGVSIREVLNLLVPVD